MPAYCVYKELREAIDYFKGQVRILKGQQQREERILLNEAQRIRLAAHAEPPTRELPEKTTALFTPETVQNFWTSSGPGVA